jgi:hypothetical protein
MAGSGGSIREACPIEFFAVYVSAMASTGFPD